MFTGESAGSQLSTLITQQKKESIMKLPRLCIFSLAFFLLSGCSFFGARQSTATPAVLSQKPLAMPVGKNWQIIEEPPQLNDGRGRLPFQTEQSVLPPGAKPVAPAENRTIETQH